MFKRFIFIISMILVALACACEAFAAPQSADYMSGSRQTSYSYIEDSSNASVTLVAGVTGQTVTLYKYTLATLTADNFYLQCGTRQITARKYLGATSGLDSMFYPLYIRCASGEALKLIKGTSTTPIGIDFWFNQQ